MSKRKTRQEKIIADLHRKMQLHSSVSSSGKQEISLEKDTISKAYMYTSHQPQATATVFTTPSYIKHDLIKTMTVTTVIVLAQLLLYYLLKIHLITLPMVGY